MNTWKQFWALSRFEFRMKWVLVLLVPVVFSISNFDLSKDNSLSFLVLPPNFTFVAIFALQLLAPEIFQSMYGKVYGSSLDILFSSAVERRLIWRARTMLFYLLLLLSALIGAVRIISQSDDLHLRAWSQKEALAYVEKLPGSVVSTDTEDDIHVTVQGGGYTLSSWYLWINFVILFIVQGIVVLIWPLRWRRFLFWAAFILIMSAPLLGILPVFFNSKNTFTAEDVFYLYFQHPWLAWGLLFCVLIPGQLRCERRFGRMELT